jgi:predicted HTH domain antitoxin
MSVQVTISLPDSAFSAMRRRPKDLARDMRVAAAAKWFEAGMLSQAKAAELAGLSRAEFLDALNRLKVSPFQYEPGDLAREMNA